MIRPLKHTPLGASILLALNIILYSPSLLAAPGDNVGSEFQVNTETIGSQAAPSIAMDTGGGFVIVWHSDNGNGTDTDSYGIYAQRYRADGNTVGGEFQVNTGTIADQRNPSIAMDADGDFVIVWQTNGGSGSDTFGYGIYAQRYRADGNTVGGEFQVNTEIINDQIVPRIAMAAEGDFVITWQSYSSDNGVVHAQRYQADGSTAEGEFQVNTETNAVHPSIAIDVDGDFVIAWQSINPDGSNNGVYAQRYQVDGNTVGSEFQVNTETSGNQAYPSIAMDADGDFVIVWHSNSGSGTDTDGYGIYAQRYRVDGNTVGGEFQVNTKTSGNQVYPSIAMAAEGDFVIAWDSYAAGADIYAQRYQADGKTAGGEFQVNTETNDAQHAPHIALDADGDFVVTWQSLNQDGSDYGVYAQRYEGAEYISRRNTTLFLIIANIIKKDKLDPAKD